MQTQSHSGARDPYCFVSFSSIYAGAAEPWRWRHAIRRKRLSRLSLCRGTDHYFVYIDIGWLLDRERNRAGDCLWRHRKLFFGSGELRLHFRIRHIFREVRFDGTRRNYCHAQFIASLLAQSFGDGTKGRASGLPQVEAGVSRILMQESLL